MIFTAAEMQRARIVLCADDMAALEQIVEHAHGMDEAMALLNAAGLPLSRWSALYNALLCLYCT